MMCFQPIRSRKFCGETSRSNLAQKNQNYPNTLFIKHFAALCSEAKYQPLKFGLRFLSYRLRLLSCPFLCWALTRLHFDGKRFGENF